MFLKTYVGEWLIQDEALWRWSLEKEGYNRVGALEDLVPYEAPEAGPEDGVAWKVEDGLLWRWDPDLADPEWLRVGPLNELVRRAPDLELPACTVEQALLCGEILVGSGGPASGALCAVFPDVGRAVHESARGEPCLRPEEVRLGEWDAANIEPLRLRRALALALRALSDRLLEVAGS